MKKIFTSFFLVLTFVLFLRTTSAQTDITPIITGGPAASQNKVMLAPKQSEAVVELSGSGLVPNFEVYIINCLPTNEGEKCTTGNPDYDSDAILGIGGIPPQVAFIDGGEAKRTTDNLGRVKATVKFIVTQSIGNTFYGVQINPPVLTNEGRNDSLQYGTFQFDPAIRPIDFRADPKGRIFDSQSLEPISNVQVTILNENKQPYTDADVTNCKTGKTVKGSTSTVCEDGQFNFLVPQGVYYLSLNQATHPNHTFSANPILNTNYIKAYAGPTEYCYQGPGETHQTCAKLYQPDEAINENPPDEVERDIPLDPGTNSRAISEPVSITYGNYSVGLNTRFEGKVSHPFSIIKLIGVTSAGEYATTKADKYGKWDITLANDTIQNEDLTLTITKVDLTQDQPTSRRPSLFSQLKKFLLSFWQKDVSAQTKNPIFQPIPRYLEGYAYDSSGKIIPNATVKIKLEMNPSKKAVYYQTTADENGFFKVDPNNLPTFSYYLEFVKPGSTTAIKMSISQFAQKNRSYLENNNINLMTAKKEEQSLITQNQARTPTAAQPSAAEIISPPPTISGGTSAMIVILLLVFGLVALTVVLYLYLHKKKNPPSIA